MYPECVGWLFRTQAVLAVSFIACGAGSGVRQGSGPAPANTPVVTTQDALPIRGMEAEVSCSDTKLRAGEVRFRWISPPALRKQQALQLTVYKRGFEQGTFVTADLSVDRPRIQLSARALENKNAATAFAGLSVSDSVPPPDSGTMVLKIEGVRPGATYFWRVFINAARPVSTSAMRFEGPICPADLRDEH